MLPDVLDDILADVDDALWRPAPQGGRGRLLPQPRPGRLAIRDSVRALATAPKVLALLAELYGRRPLPFQTLNFRRGTQQAPHSDALHFNTDARRASCAASGWRWRTWTWTTARWSTTRAATSCPRCTMQELGLEASKEEYTHYEEHVAELIEREGLEPRYGTIKKGQALVWASNLLHGGAPQRDRERSRHSQVTHYFFEGCQYYTPMLSEPGKIRWRDPEWIT